MIYKDIKWLNKQGALIPSLPPHKTVDLTIGEQKELLNTSKAFLIRWHSLYDIEEGNFWYIVKDNFNGMEELSSNTRSKIRRGQKRLYTKKISLDLIDEIYSVYYETSKKYATFENIMTKDEFKRYINNLDSEKYEFFGVFDKGSDLLVAYAQNFIDDNSCFYEELFFHPKYLKNYCSYVLIYDMNKYYLEDNNFAYVHDGSRNLSHITNIHNFLIEKFKFKKVYSKMEIAYRKDVEIAVKILYPLKPIIDKIELNTFKKISVLLKHEEIRRSYE